MRFIRAFFAFWYDFIVGDDWRIAVGVVAVIVIAGVAARADVDEGVIAVAIGLAVIGLTFASIVGEAVSQRRDR